MALLLLLVTRHTLVLLVVTVLNGFVPKTRAMDVLEFPYTYCPFMVPAFL